MHHHQPLAVVLLSLAALSTAQAANVALLPSSGWNEFVIDDPQFSIAGTDFAWHDLNGGGDIGFTFSVRAGQLASLRVVDGGFAGDVFSVKSNGTALANTGAATNSYPTLAADYDAAFADVSFSKNTYTFGPGDYRITGALFSSALDGNRVALNSTVGALQLSIFAVPEAPTLSLVLIALCAVSLLTRRRAG